MKKKPTIENRQRNLKWKLTQLRLFIFQGRRKVEEASSSNNNKQKEKKEKSPKGRGKGHFWSYIIK